MTLINTFFLRVAARCNLSCDYCYVFRHRDMSWKNMPAHMALSTVELFASRLKEYLSATGLKEANIIYHGGEPLIVGPERIIEFTDIICRVVGEIAKVSFSLQTNGTLLNEHFLNQCRDRNIGISLSFDGHKAIHDKHRKYVTGSGSFDDVYSASKLLQRFPSIFEGIIGVIDPQFEPEETLKFFEENGLLTVDMLLPDSTYQDPPLGRNCDPALYSTWLCKAFDSWFFHHQSINFRTFEHVLKGLMGIESSLDSFGLGELDYLTIETDGAYHTTDILKSTYENASALGLTLTDAAITKALEHEKIAEYNRLLSWDCLPQVCKDCRFGAICGGGSLPHRYSPENGFDNPTVYCEEMKTLIEHAEQVLKSAIEGEKV